MHSGARTSAGPAECCERSRPDVAAHYGRVACKPPYFEKIDGRWGTRNKEPRVMNSRERVIAALQRRVPDRVPFFECVIDERVMDALLPG